MSEVPRIIRILDRGYTMIWREGRLDEALRGLDEDFEWVTPTFPNAPIHYGPTKVIGLFRDWMEPFEGLEVDWELHEAGSERALAIIRMRGRGRVSGVPTEVRFGQLWTFREGRAARMVLYDDVDEARRAAGLDES